MGAFEEGAYQTQAARHRGRLTQRAANHAAERPARAVPCRWLHAKGSLRLRYYFLKTGLGMASVTSSRTPLPGYAIPALDRCTLTGGFFNNILLYLLWVWKCPFLKPDGGSSRGDQGIRREFNSYHAGVQSMNVSSVKSICLHRVVTTT